MGYTSGIRIFSSAAARTKGGVRRVACILGILFSLASCTEASPLRKAMDSTQMNSVLNLDSFLPANSRICVIGPYQDRVSNENPDHAKINAFLQNSDLPIDEGHWHFLVVEPDSVSAQTFKTSSLDLLKPTETSRFGRLIPADFAPVNCAEASKARLYKLSLNNRTYVLLGEQK